MKLRSSSNPLIAFILVVFIACSFLAGLPCPVNASGSVILTLYVHDGSAYGPVIRGAQVNGSDGANSYFSQTTGSGGYVTITGTPGTWQFTVTAGGYQSVSWDQSITDTCRKDAFVSALPQQSPPYQSPSSQAPSYQAPSYQAPQQVTLTLYVHDGSAYGPVIRGPRSPAQMDPIIILAKQLVPVVM